MKKLFLYLTFLAGVTGVLSACKRDQVVPAPEKESFPIIYPEISADSTRRFFSTEFARLPEASNPTRPVFEFTINPTDQPGKLQTVEVYKSFRRGLLLGPRVKVGDYSSFPATVSLNSQEAITDLKTNTLITIKGSSTTARNTMQSGDAVIFSFEYITQDGRRIVLTPLKNGIIQGPFSIAPFVAVAVFKSR